MKSWGFIFLLIFSYLQLQSQKVGVVLSGGGAAGAAHVGVLKALEEQEVPIDYIVGTSIGALIAGLYASGYSPEEIEQMITSPEFRRTANGIVDDRYTYYIKKSDINSSIITIRFNLDSIFGTNLPTNFVSSVPMDYDLMEYFSPASAAANSNYDSLMIPFRCLAANISQQKQIIFKEGNLSTAIRASMTYPFYIPPVSINGDLLFDGGLYNNFPVDIMCQEFAPDYIIASNVADKREKPTEDNLFSQLRNIFTRETDFEINCSKGIIINTDVSDIATFDFYGSDLALRRGYETSLFLLDSIKQAVNRTTKAAGIQEKRSSFRKKLPPLKFDSIQFDGIYKSQSYYFKRSVRLNKGAVSSTDLKPAYYQLTSNEKIKSAYPSATYDSVRNVFRLHLKIKEEKDFSASFGGVISTKPFSTGFFQLDYQLLRSTELKASGNIYFGNFYNSAQGKLRWNIPFDLPFYLESQLTNNQFDYFNGRATFIDENDPPYIITSDIFWESKIGLPVFTKGKILIGYSYLWQEYEYYQSNNFVRGDTSDLTRFEGSKTFISYERNSLNRRQYATKGSMFNLSLSRTNGREDTEPGSTAPFQTPLSRRRNWLSIHLKFDKYFFRKNNFHLGTYLEGNYSDLPRFQNYTASVLMSPAFAPLPENRTIFQQQYRARSYAGLGIKAIYSYRDLIDIRAEAYLYQPYETLVSNADGTVDFGEEAINRDFIGTITTVYHSPLGPLAASLNYYDNTDEEFSFLIHFGYILFNKNGLD